MDEKNKIGVILQNTQIMLCLKTASPLVTGIGGFDESDSTPAITLVLIELSTPTILFAELSLHLTTPTSNSHGRDIANDSSNEKKNISVDILSEPQRQSK